MQQKIMITGDDILIEYVARLVKQLSQTTTVDALRPTLLQQIEKFVVHYVWKQPDQLEAVDSSSNDSRIASN